MKCPNCGFDNEDNVKFCNKCGAVMVTDTAVAADETDDGETNEHKTSKTVAATVVLISVSLVLIFGALVAGLLYYDKKHNLPEEPFAAETYLPIETVSDGKYATGKDSYWLSPADDGTYRVYNKDTYIGNVPVDFEGRGYTYSPDKTAVLFFAEDCAYLVTDGAIKTVAVPITAEYDMSRDGKVIYFSDTNGDLYRFTASDSSVTVIDSGICDEKYINSSPDGNTVLYHKAFINESGSKLYEMYVYTNGEIISIANNSGYLCGYSVSNGAETIYATDIAFGGLFLLDITGDALQLANIESTVSYAFTSSDKEDIMLIGKDGIYIKEYTEKIKQSISGGYRISELMPLYSVSSGQNFGGRVFRNESSDDMANADFCGYYYLTSELDAYKLCGIEGSDHAISPSGDSFYYVTAQKQLVRYSLGDIPTEGVVLVNGGVTRMRVAADGTVWYLTDTFELHCIAEADKLAASEVYSFEAAHDGTVFYETWNGDKRSGDLMCISKSNSARSVDEAVDGYFCMPGYTCYIKNYSTENGGADIYIGTAGNSFTLVSQRTEFGPLSY